MSGHLPFRLQGTLPDPRADYSLRVLVDMDGDGQIGRGDFINTVSYAVKSGVAQSPLIVHVRKAD